MLYERWRQIAREHRNELGLVDSGQGRRWTLGELDGLVEAAERTLRPGGRLAVISFHSLEDRVVKRFMQRESQLDPALADLPVLPPGMQPRLKRVGRKSRPDQAEIKRNPRARSALLRVAEKVA